MAKVRPISDERRIGSWLRLFATLAMLPLLVSFASAAPQKVRVSDPVLAKQLLERGGQVLADYGSFKIIRTEDDSAVGLRGGRAEDTADQLRLNARSISTQDISKQRPRSTRTPANVAQLHLVQFVGPIKPAWREQLQQLGAQIVSYVPANAYLIRGEATTLARVQAWAVATDYVQWDDAYAAEDKLAPSIRRRPGADSRVVQTNDLFAVQLIESAADNPATLTLIDALKLQPIRRDFRVLQYRNLIVRLPPGRLDELTVRPDVVSIQLYQEPQLRDERQAQIIAGAGSGSQPTGPDYFGWLAGKGFTQEQFDASGFVVDISDSGIDNGTTAPGHLALYHYADASLGSRVAYNRLFGTPHSGSTLAGLDGHGNLNAHILAGYANNLAGFPHTDSAGFQYGLGVCPFVQIGSSVVFDPDQFTHPDYVELQARAYQDGARISVNSWGAPDNTYSIDAQAYDALVRDAQPAGSVYDTPGNQEMVILFAAGNSGPAPHSVGAPGTAKNVITVGASENVRSLNIANGGSSAFGSDGGGYTDLNADTADDLALFSSRGPCSDGRQKPDLVAPGTHVVGGVPQSALTLDGLGTALSGFKASSILALSGSGTPGSPANFFPLGQQFYTVSSGTSHAVPAVAGACALLRQYFLNQNQPAPSPAMTKAYLMNSARYLTGAGVGDDLWSSGQGLGAVWLDRAFDATPRILRDQTTEDIFTASGQTRVFTGRIVDADKPLRVTLAWTDAPGSTVGDAFNNDLDLVVQIGTNRYLGNVFSGSDSIQGGSADSRNNAESVLLPAGVSGDIVVTVLAANINSDGVPNYGGPLDQDFALVIYNATNTAVPLVRAAAATLAAEGFTPANQAADPGEMVAVQLALENYGTLDASNLWVTLLATNGVSNPSAAMNYGDLTSGAAPVGRNFGFTAVGDCGGVISLMFRLQDDSGDLGLVNVELPLGQRIITTQQFTNATELIIPDSGPASLFPSPITVTGMSGKIIGVTAILDGLTHAWPEDVDVLLVGPNGQKVMLLSDCGGGNSCSNLQLNFSDAATQFIPQGGPMVSGTYKPTNYGLIGDVFSAPAPGGGYGDHLNAFVGGNPNGTWRLFVQDDSAMSGGCLLRGWSLSLTTSNLVCASANQTFADLGITVEMATNRVATWSNFTMTITVTNHGANPATFVTVSNQFPASYLLDTAVADCGLWALTNSTGLWEIGALDPGEVVSLELSGRCLLAGEFVNSSLVRSFTDDPQLTNNGATLEFSVVKIDGPGLGVGSSQPPSLSPLSDRVVHAGSPVHFMATATVPDSPTNELAFSLLSGAPATAIINPVSGEFFWQTLDVDANTTNLIAIQVASVVNPTQTDTGTFHILVQPRPLMTNIIRQPEAMVISWSAISGQQYQLETTTNLLSDSWEELGPALTAVNSAIFYTNSLPIQSQQFYRVRVIP